MNHNSENVFNEDVLEFYFLGEYQYLVLVSFYKYAQLIFLSSQIWIQKLLMSEEIMVNWPIPFLCMMDTKFSITGFRSSF